MVSTFRLHDWNDARLLLACAEHGGFAAAAQSLGLDQTTVSRRVAAIEALVGRPLFTRRRSGASPTPAGEAVLERARALEDHVRALEGAMAGLGFLPPPTVTISASEGILTYLVIPALLGSPAAEIPLDRRLIRQPVPELAFTTVPGRGDIAVIATNPGDLPKVRGAVRVRRIGTMTFVPVASEKYLKTHGMPERFEDLAEAPLLDIAIYRGVRALDDWHGLVSQAPRPPMLIADNTSSVQKPLIEGNGITILPPYSRLYDSRVVTLTTKAPRLAVVLWLSAHEDTLREPALRVLYDTLGEMFVESPWFRT